MERKIAKANFWNVGTNGDRNLYEDELDWNGNDTWQRDAQSTYPEDIFRYYVEIGGLNILFYWLDDEKFYSIFTESTPIVVKSCTPRVLHARQATILAIKYVFKPVYYTFIITNINIPIFVVYVIFIC